MSAAATAAATSAPRQRWAPATLAVVAAALLLWLLVSWPLLAGRQTFFFRDLFGLFAPLKAFGVAQLRGGSIPALDPALALGQPFRGNPNSTAFYPTNLLFLVLPFWVAFNLHLCLHWLLGGFTMGLFCRRSGSSGEAAAVGGLAYAGGGWMLSALSFYNVIAVAAWWPLVLLGAHRGGRRGICLGGLACGMALLAGEPVTAALGVLPLAALAVGRWGWRRGLLTVTAIGGLGLLVALPQAVASARVLPFSFRGTHGVLASQAETYRLRPARLLELLVPLPFGSPGRPQAGSWSARVVPYTPFYYALYPGAVATFLALLGFRRRPGLAVLCGVSVLAAWAPGVTGRMLTAGLLGLFRSPEKAILWLALAWPLLAAAGLDAGRQSEPENAKARGVLRLGLALGGALLLAAAAVAALARRSAGHPVVEPTLAPALLGSALLVGLTAWGLWRRLPQLVVGLQLLALLPLQPLLLIEPTAPYRQPSPWTVELPGRRAVLPLGYTYPSWEADQGPPESPARRSRRLAFELGPVPGVLSGSTYPLAPDLDGLHQRFFDYLLFRTSQDGWERRLPWLRTVGVDTVTAPHPLPDGLTLRGVRFWGHRSSYLYTVDHPAPALWWPRALRVAGNPAIGYEQVAAQHDPTDTAVVPFPLPHHGGERIRLLRAGPDHVEVAAEGPGGLLVVRRAFQPLWRARAEGTALQVLPADVVLTGIVVPAGAHRVELYVSAAPEIAAAAVAVAAVLALLAALLAGRGARARSAHALT